MAEIARAAGILEFHATVLAENRKMIEVLSHSGLPQTQAWKDGILDVKLSLSDRRPDA